MYNKVIKIKGDLKIMITEFDNELFNFVKEKEPRLKEYDLKIVYDNDITAGSLKANTKSKKAILKYNNKIYDKQIKNIIDTVLSKANYDYPLDVNIFIILHEIGHLHQYCMKSYNEICDLRVENKFKALDLLFMENDKERWNLYRNLPCEKYADNFAINFFTRYKKEIHNLLSKYLLKILVDEEHTGLKSLPRCTTTKEYKRVNMPCVKKEKEVGIKYSKLKKLRNDNYLMK